MRGIDPITGVGATQRHVRHRRAPRWRGPTGSGNIMHGWIDPPSRIMFRWVIVRVIINGAVILVMMTRGTGRGGVGF